MNGWIEFRLSSFQNVIKQLDKLSNLPRPWIFRGTAKEYDMKLIPSIDRLQINNLERAEKIILEMRVLIDFELRMKNYSCKRKVAFYARKLPH